jgi:hypothetical protein
MLSKSKVLAATLMLNLGASCARTPRPSSMSAPSGVTPAWTLRTTCPPTVTELMFSTRNSCLAPPARTIVSDGALVDQLVGHALRNRHAGCARVDQHVGGRRADGYRDISAVLGEQEWQVIGCWRRLDLRIVSLGRGRGRERIGRRRGLVDPP